MLGSLRFRLTALFLAAVLVFGLVSIGLAVRFFQSITREQSTQELEREAEGLAARYREAALAPAPPPACGTRGRRARARPSRHLRLHSAERGPQAARRRAAGAAGE